MQRSITAFHRAEAQRTHAEQRYLETVPPKDSMEELEARLFLHDLASVASRPQYELAVLRLQGCQRQFEIVRKRRRNFVVFRRQGGDKIKRFLAQKECSQFAASGA